MIIEAIIGRVKAWKRKIYVYLNISSHYRIKSGFWRNDDTLQIPLGTPLNSKGFGSGNHALFFFWSVEDSGPGHPALQAGQRSRQNII